MKKYIYAVGTLTFALAISGLPAVVVARDSGNGVEVEGSVKVRVVNVSASTTMQVRTNDEMENQESEATTSANSFEELKQKIEIRKQELNDEEASTTLENQEVVKDSNPVRLAVHALLSSKNLLGGIGEEVSRIARDMNDSVATTTNAEINIKSRNFFTRFFFGGDNAAADVISREVAKNQENIQKLTDLLNQTSLSIDIQATLRAQIKSLEEAQTRLQNLAQKEQKQWGLFSWRF